MLRLSGGTVSGSTPQATLGAWLGRGLVMAVVMSLSLARPAPAAAQTEAGPTPAAPTPQAPVPAPAPAPAPSPEAVAPLPAETTSTPAPAPAAPSVMLMPITHSGVDPVVPRRTGETLTRVLVDLGYTIADPLVVTRAYSMLRPTDPPSPADVFRMTIFSSAARGLHVQIGVEGNSYVAEILIASADGTGPFRAHVVGGPREFLARCEQALRATMPPPAAYDAAAAARYAADARATPLAVPGDAFAPAGMPMQSGPMRPAAPSFERGPHFGLTFVSESAFGRNDGSRFYNHILGARLDIHLGQNIVLGAFAGYVNLDRGSQRVSNVLGYLQLEDRLRFGVIRHVQFPIRFGFGYLPRNGPFLRLSGGLRVKLGDTLELGIDLIAPTFWWIPGDRRVTYDIGLELTYRFGAED